MNRLVVFTLLLVMVTLTIKVCMMICIRGLQRESRVSQQTAANGVAAGAARRVRGISDLKAGGVALQVLGLGRARNFGGWSADPSALNERPHFSTPPQLTYPSTRLGPKDRRIHTIHRHPETGTPRVWLPAANGLSKGSPWYQRMSVVSFGYT